MRFFVFSIEQRLAFRFPPFFRNSYVLHSSLLRSTSQLLTTRASSQELGHLHNLANTQPGRSPLYPLFPSSSSRSSTLFGSSQVCSVSPSRFTLTLLIRAFPSRSPPSSRWPSAAILRGKEGWVCPFRSDELCICVARWSRDEGSLEGAVFRFGYPGSRVGREHAGWVAARRVRRPCFEF